MDIENFHFDASDFIYAQRFQFHSLKNYLILLSFFLSICLFLSVSYITFWRAPLIYQ